jgi:signal transduction histidine kinase
MKDRSRRTWPAYAGAVALVALAALPPCLLPLLEPAASALFFAAVALSARAGGLGPGLLATALSVLALDYFFLPPVYALGVAWADGLCLAVFVLAALLFSSLHAAQRRREQSLRHQARAKDRFLAVLAHELRTPLAAVLSGLEVLRRHPGGSAAARARELAARQARTMGQLIGDLLDASRTARGKVRLERARVDLAAVVVGAAEAVAPLVEERRHHLEVVVPPGPLYLEGDALRLHEVFVNLLTNAARYTAAGGHIRLGVEPGPGEAVVRVRDDGVGIAPETLPRVFDLFVQAEDGSQGGLGIGLHLAQALVRLHGGTVTAASDGPGRGSEFVVRLPLRGVPGRQGKRVNVLTMRG